MYIKISFCHGRDWMLRVCRETSGSMDSTSKHTLYGLDPESQNSWPCSVGHLDEGDELRHCIIEGTDAGVNGWKHDFTFYAYKTDQLGATPYAVGHKKYKDGLKYRISENATFAGDHGWAHDFVFYAYSGKSDGTMLVSLGSRNDGDWFEPKVVLGVTAKDNVFKHVAVCKIFKRQHSGTTLISVGHYGDGNGRRYVISKGSHAGPVWDIWRQDFQFYGLMSAKAGTIPVSVTNTKNYWGGENYLMCLDESVASVDRGEGDITFYMHLFDKSQLIEVAVGCESEHWCYRLKPNMSNAQDCRFEHEFTFFAFSSPYPGTLPISIGKAGAEHNRTLRNRVEYGNYAGTRGWEHEFLLYVYPIEEPGTIPIAVGHAEFALGGWKYRVCENSLDAGTKGWTHDFVFYAYPHPRL